MVDVAAIGGERRPASREAADDDPEGVDYRNAENKQRDGDFGGAQDRQHRQAVTHEHDPARARENRSGVEVPAQKARQRSGKDETEQGNVRLGWFAGEADDPQGQSRNQSDAGRKPIQAVDEVDAVDHADDPDQRGDDGYRAGDGDAFRGEGDVDDGYEKAQGHGHARPRELTHALQ